MSKYVTQLRYYGTGQDSHRGRNNPVNLTYNDLSTGIIFNQYSPITQLGIQSSPDLEVDGKIFHPTFSINSSSSEIQIGRTGIFELDLEGVGSINKLMFKLDFLKAIDEYNRIHPAGKACLIIDLVYEG